MLVQSARVRRVSLPIEPITKVATNILAKIQKFNQNIVILFGSERIGLLNEELLMNNVYAYIPPNEGYTSLPSSSELVAYEIYKQAVEISNLKEVPEYNHLHKKASVKELQGLYQHFEDSMIKEGF